MNIKKPQDSLLYQATLWFPHLAHTTLKEPEKLWLYGSESFLCHLLAVKARASAFSTSHPASVSSSRNGTLMIK